MGFPKLFAAMKRRLAKQRNDTSFDTLADDDDDAESWRGCLNATGTEDWNRIQEGQRMLQLSTSMWYETSVLHSYFMTETLDFRGSFMRDMADGCLSICYSPFRIAVCRPMFMPRHVSVHNYSTS